MSLDLLLQSIADSQDFQQSLRQCRDYLHSIIKCNPPKLLNADIIALLKCTFETVYLTRSQQQRASLAFTEDVYDCLSLCELPEFFEVFKTQEARIQQLSDSDKYVILKICNAMLKRLSITHETLLRGKIHVFLTQIFSTLHVSGTKKLVNLKDRNFEDDKSQAEGIPYSFYKSFWSLQKYLNNIEQISKSDEPGTESVKVRNLMGIQKVINRTLQHFKDNQPTQSTCVKRFPRFLTKYQLFKDQLNDESFRKVFLNQVLLFIFTIENEASFTKEEKSILAPIKAETQRQLDTISIKMANLIETERVWPLWMRESMDVPEQPIDRRNAEKGKLKRLEIQRRILDDQKSHQTTDFENLLKPKVFKLEVNPIEAGLNFYVNDVLTQMNPHANVSEADRCKNIKDYAWKSVRVLSKFFLKELRITNLILQEKLPNLEELIELVRKSDPKPAILKSQLRPWTNEGQSRRFQSQDVRWRRPEYVYLSYQAAGDRRKLQQLQMKDWIQQQIKEKEEIKKLQKQNHQLYDQQTLEINRVRKELEEEQYRKRVQMEIATQQRNDILAKEKLDKEAYEAKLAEHDNQIHQKAIMTNDVWTENVATCQSALAPHRVIPYHYKGMSQEQQMAIRNEQAHQRTLNEQKKKQQADDEKMWAQYNEHNRRMLINLERDKARKLDTLKHNTKEFNLLQKEEQRIKLNNEYA